ncbi:hypothetical protein QN277_026944 [Acacia crassicarpa]|uniref:PH domain-containing protein n=1 Tax=Acacia crassicarpa TaxID=499986 RepID=A0AAE1J8R1_9FABA|nr:hypothetical protein QN277_026944 [Acacia crassicarpa]
MFEAHVLHLLRRYLGEYVHGLSTEALRISVWKGDVVLKDLKLKAEALNALKLPVTVKAGFVGTITLKVPWKSLGKEPVIVLIDRIFVLANPAQDGRTMKEEDRKKLFEAKIQQIEEAESATLDAISKSKLGNLPSGNSWLSSIIATIIGNLKISISNVHIRYEDTVSNPGHPFSSGVTLAKLAAVTMDEHGNETFDTSGALDKLRKSLQLERLALYHDSDCLLWEINKRWDDMNPQEWIEIFEDGINETSVDNRLVSKWAMNRTYLVSPINANLQYHRLGNQEKNNPEIPFEKVSLVLSDVSLTVTEAQYHDWIKLLEAVSRYKTYLEVSHLRPSTPVSKAPELWWKYAAQAGLQQKRMCYRLSWDQIRHLCQHRRQYIQLYMASLQHSSHVNHAEIREIEKDLDPKVILLWRLLAHAKVESVKSKVAAQRRTVNKRSWFSFRWRDDAEQALSDDASKELNSTEQGLTKEEWEAIDKLLSYQPDEDLALTSKDMQNMTKLLITISIGQAAARIISVNQMEIVCGRFEQLHVSTKFKHRSIYCDLLLKFYGLSAPEGSLAQSVSSEQKVNALAASFVHLPIGENIDWRLSATISPCHVTVLMESVDRFLEFVRRSNAVSPTVALETATALQMKFEKVTRRAQEQFQMALEEQRRFAFDIDLDAPKVRVPLRFSGSQKCDSHFILDFGHFTLHTVESQSDEQRKNPYYQFLITGRDIAAFFTDCDSDYGNCSLVKPSYGNQQLFSSVAELVENQCSLIDRCGMAVLVDQIKVPHPSYPSTRISVQVPNLGIHFSPERYFKIMELLNIFYGTIESCSQPTADNFQAKLSSWSPADLATDGRILVWRGIGNSIATWQPCFLLLSGSYLYVFESAKSQSYQRYLSMGGRQVVEVPPANIGGSPFCIAVCFRGMDILKALESSSTWILDFRDEEEKATWFKGLVQATYQASAAPSVDVLGDSKDDTAASSYVNQRNERSVDLTLKGALMEMKLFIYGKVGDIVDGKLDECLILEVLGGGGKVHLIHADGDLTVKMKLHSLKIKDELQGHVSVGEHYLAVSVLKNETPSTCSDSLNSHGKDVSVGLPEDDDSFMDALSEFMSQHDAGNYMHNMSLDQQGLVGIPPDFESLKTFIQEKGVEEGHGTPCEVYYEIEGVDNLDFISVTFSTRSSGSPDYDGIDTQMNVRMSKLEFFCNRPTIVALISFGLDMSSVAYTTNHMETTATDREDSLVNKEKIDEKGHVKGMLGFGKERVLFYLNMNVDSVTMFLNKEDGSQLATLVQESFLLDLKVHPSSLSIEGTLGNFRLCDRSLGTDHSWAWLCDLRNPGTDSLIRFKFNSYQVEDDEYQGYDYSLQGHLSAVRIVFLYRFVQEIMVYFMELASPHTGEATKLVDKVGGFEWLIQKYEIDGSAALKLDLTLDTPIIVVPRDSQSKEFIQLDLGKLHITNEFSWHGSPEDPSAVRMDILYAEILGINMTIGIDGCLGNPMIREGQGLEILVRRSLRDVFRKVPSFSLEIKVDLLHAVLSEKEYKVILDCTYMNLSEEPMLPPSFRGGNSISKDTIRLLVDKVNMNSQLLLSQTVTVVAVVVNHALLELCYGIDVESPLAHIALEGLWASYRMTSLSEKDLYVTIPKFSILDVRPHTKPEMRLMLGSSTDASKQIVPGKIPSSFNNSSSLRTSDDAGSDIDLPILTMFLMDYRWRVSSQSFVIRVQQPRVLVVPDFLLAVAEFFVPALGVLTGREECMDPKNDRMRKNNRIVLMEPVYKQTEDVVHLSPSKQLVADCVGIDEYIYDGCGKCICLSVEKGAKELRSTTFRPIIFIGCGKRLRFVNVKIENGSLLGKYTYLSNDSSYSVSVDDGVNIVFLDNSLSGDNSIDQNLQSAESLSSIYSQSDSNEIQSFTFETQVVSPEFTFYDGTKSFLDDSSYGEKLIRAKLDLSFIYASKEKDTWIRALVKDFTVEAGSGLIILDPVDISGGYTSVKDKTNISLVSTDICLHLSLSAISLILNLQSQASAALNFGNATPLVPCTNFDRIWVSQKGTNITFWRPRAPTNYVVLGDCVTSRPVPPSQAVMAVSNTYGRVRKPVRFLLIGSFMSNQDLGGDEGYTDASSDCSLWLPVAPPGYTALGCVAHFGNQPPPNHVVHCLRSDLVTSTSYSDCLFISPAHVASCFSIWRLDNVIGSFFAHSSAKCPPKDRCYDLSRLLLWNSNLAQPSPLDPVSDFSSGDIENQQAFQSANASGWDILRSIPKATNYMSSPNFERIWWDKGGDLRRPVSIWRPVARLGYTVLGDCITEGLEPPALGIIFKNDNPDISAKPVQFTKVAHIVGKGIEEIFFWYPIAPPGYVSLGCVVSKTDEAPCADLFCCPRMDLVSQANIHEVPLSRSSSSRAPHCWSIWKVENQACTFLARSDLKKPSSRLAYIIGNPVKPKTQENITADLRLRFLSLTILDSVYGMGMTPLFDTTITNIKLATHGGLESMNAVLISSIAASTFNAQLEAWEPLVEPFDGIFKFETYHSNVNLQSGLAKRIRIAATNILNVNVSAANLESFVGCILSWRRQLELEKKASKLKEEVGSLQRDGDDATFSALDEDDLQTVVVENKLGCDIYVKKVEQDVDMVDKLHHGDCASVWIPPARFSDRLNVLDESREARCYIAVKIIEAKGLPLIDDGNSHNFFCALRLVVDSQATDQQKLFPQSARTKCVKPIVSRINGRVEGIVKWNELFIFEVPRKAPAKMEIEVTNLAAKAGKGDVVSSLSFPVGHDANILRKAASMKMVHHPYDVQNIISYPLRRMVQQNNVDDMQNGNLLVSTSYVERNTIANLQKDVKSEDDADRDTGFRVGLGPEGEWKSVRSLLPLSVVPKSLENEFFAMEVVMKNGKKHAIFRSLVTVVNDSDVRLNIFTCHSSLSLGTDFSHGARSNINAVEEVFQNQYYHPISGWGNKWPAHLENVGHWSTRDFSYSSKDFFEPPLPPGCKWMSGWAIDKSRFVDNDGWAYGPDLVSLKWPPTSKSSAKTTSDVVRRRRWIRSRQNFSGQGVDSMQSEATIVNPGASYVLCWKSTKKDSDECLQVRPRLDDPQFLYSWGRTVAIGSSSMFGKEQFLLDEGAKQNSLMPNCSLKLNQLEKKDVLLCCSPSRGNMLFWLSVGTDASVLNTELNAPIYDWKISINSPMKLENRLPSPAEFTVWEKPKEGNFIKRHHGVISSRQSAHIYSADIQKPLYLTLSVQGGWLMEKDPVLVLDPSFTDNVTSFWMIHQQSRRKLRVSIEYDMGATSAAPKTLRLFVPYWIVNESSLALAYRVVEVEPSENTDMDSVLLSRAVKSAKTALKNPLSSMDKRHSISRRNLQVLEAIEDSSPFPSMLSPQDCAVRSGLTVFQSQKDTSLSPRVGIAVSMHHSEVYSPGISLLELENKERIDVKAFDSDGSYCKLSALLNVTSDRTKVIHFQPHTLFINRAGCSLCLQQCGSEASIWIHPTDPPKSFVWQSSARVELLKLCMEGYQWSAPFSVNNEGEMRINLKNNTGDGQMQLRVLVRSGAKRSRFEVIFRPNSLSSPYRIENHSMFLPIRFRQVDGTSDSWQLLLPNAAASFLWEDVGRRRLLELIVDGTDPQKSLKYDIDQISDHQPIHVTDESNRAFCVTIVKEEKINVVKISDWLPETEPTGVLSGKSLSSMSQTYKSDSQKQQSLSVTDCEFHIFFELAELGISVIDHTPEEILYLSIQNLVLAYSTGLGSGINRFKLKMRGLQVDNQLPLTPMPVLFRPQRVMAETDYILKFSMTMQSNGSLDLCVYPYIGLHGPQNSASFLINIHEPIIWRLHEMIQQVKLSRLHNSQTTAASVDPIIQIGVLNISEVRLKVSMAMSPSQRPRGVLGFWASLMTALGNTENMPVRINPRFHENVCMRKSSMISLAISNIRKDLLGQPLQLLSGVDILGNASSALGHMSKGVAALSMDKKFIQSRLRQDSKGVEDFRDVIREGGGAFAKGLFRGVTGILTKPLEGAKTSGVEGFVQGVGKGIIGAAAQPVSGVLDLLSKTTEGANAMRMKIAAAITSDEQLLRRRLPRVISGDNLLQLYDDYKAQGQVILQLAESGSFFGQVDLFKVRGKFALSDAYEDHFLLPKGKILMVTHRRVILLQQPSNIIAQRKFSPAKDPCSILWDVLWDDLGTMELTNGKKDSPEAPPSRVILYLNHRSLDSKENVRIIKCNSESKQAFEVYLAIEHAMNTYGPNSSKGMLKKIMAKPYSPGVVDSPSGDFVHKEGVHLMSSQMMPGSVPLASTFGRCTKQFE